MKIEEAKQKIENNSYNSINSLIELREKFISESKEVKKFDFNIPIVLKNAEKMMSIIFISNDQNIHYSIICKNTDHFENIERLLYEKYPEYKNKNIHFTLNGEKINRSKSLDDNKIRNGDIIILKIRNNN